MPGYRVWPSVCVLFALFWATVSVAADEAKPSAQPDTNRTDSLGKGDAQIAFDAHRRTFTTWKRVKSGHKVKLRITNPNVFRETYEIKFEGTEIHGVTVPDKLGGLVFAGPARVVPIPANLAQALGPALTADNLKSALLPASLQRPYADAMNVLHSIKTDLDRGCDSVLFSPLAAPLIRSLIIEQTDSGVQKRARTEVMRIARPWREDTTEVTLPDSIMVLFERRVSSWFLLWRRATRDWREAYSTWRLANSGNFQEAEAARMLLMDGQKWIDVLQAETSAARHELELFVGTADAAVDTVRTPSTIDRTARTVGDEFTVIITIRPSPLVTEVNGHLPQEPEATARTTVLVYNRWTTDISAGPSVSQIGDSWDFSPVLFVHYVNTVTPTRALGFSLGISFSDPVRYLAGPTLEIGGRPLRLALTPGFAWGKITDTSVWYGGWGVAASIAITLPALGNGR